MRTRHLYEFFNKFADLRTKKEKQEWLLYNNNTPILRALLKINFDPNVKSWLPEGEPPFNRLLDDQVTTIEQAHKILYLFIVDNDHPAPDMRDKQGRTRMLKREKKWIEILESVHPNDAKILNQIKDKKLEVKGLTEKFIRDTMPALLTQTTEKENG